MTDLCARERATQLIAGLGGEKQRWEQFVDGLNLQYHNLTGDVISAGVMAYLGPFVKVPQTMRRGEPLQASSIPALCRPYHRPWESPFASSNGTCSAYPSTASASTTPSSSSTPGVASGDRPPRAGQRLDPNMESENDLKVIKLTDDDFPGPRKRKYQFGNPVLLEKWRRRWTLPWSRCS